MNLSSNASVHFVSESQIRSIEKKFMKIFHFQSQISKNKDESLCANYKLFILSQENRSGAAQIFIQSWTVALLIDMRNNKFQIDYYTLG